MTTKDFLSATSSSAGNILAVAVMVNGITVQVLKDWSARHGL